MCKHVAAVLYGGGARLDFCSRCVGSMQATSSCGGHDLPLDHPLQGRCSATITSARTSSASSPADVGIRVAEDVASQERGFRARRNEDDDRRGKVRAQDKDEKVNGTA